MLDDAGRHREGPDAPRAREAAQPAAHRWRCRRHDHARARSRAVGRLARRLAAGRAARGRGRRLRARTSTSARSAARTPRRLQVAADALPASAAPRTPPPALKGADHGRRRARGRAAAGRRARSPTAPARGAARAARGSAGCRCARRSRWASPRSLLGFVGCARRCRRRRRRRSPRRSQSGGRATLEVRGRPGPARRRATSPRRRRGRVYQVWLDKGGKTPEPTNALFTTSSDGSAIGRRARLARRRQARDGHRRAERRLARHRPESVLLTASA